MIRMSSEMSPSKYRTPQWYTSRNVKLSRPVTMQPNQRGHPNKRWNAMALPTTSCISLPMIASSIIA